MPQERPFSSLPWPEHTYRARYSCRPFRSSYSARHHPKRRKEFVTASYSFPDFRRLPTQDTLPLYGVSITFLTKEGTGYHTGIRRGSPVSVHLQPKSHVAKRADSRDSALYEPRFPLAIVSQDCRLGFLGAEHRSSPLPISARIVAVRHRLSLVLPTRARGSLLFAPFIVELFTAVLFKRSPSQSNPVAYVTTCELPTSAQVERPSNEEPNPLGGFEGIQNLRTDFDYTRPGSQARRFPVAHVHDDLKEQLLAPIG